MVTTLFLAIAPGFLQTLKIKSYQFLLGILHLVTAGFIGLFAITTTEIYMRPLIVLSFVSWLGMALFYFGSAAFGKWETQSAQAPETPEPGNDS